MEELINITKTPEEINLLSPLTWAYIGDCVYEIYIRTNLVNTTKLKPHAMHMKAIEKVKAHSQAETLKKIYDIERLVGKISYIFFKLAITSPFSMAFSFNSFTSFCL